MAIRVVNINENSTAVQEKAVRRSVTYVSFACIIILAMQMGAGVLIDGIVDRNDTILLLLFLMISSVLTILIPTFVCSQQQGGWRKNMRKYKHRYNHLACTLMVIWGFGLCVVLNFLIGLLCQIMPWLGSHEAAYFSFDPMTVLLIFLTMAVVPAVCEEVAFRGIFCGMLVRGGEGFAAAVSSLLFALLHSGFSGMLFAFLAGMIFASVRKTSGRLLPCIIIHFLNNAFSVSASMAYHIFSLDTYNTFLYTAVGISALMMLIAALILAIGKVHLFRYRRRACVLDTATKITVSVGNPSLILLMLLAVIQKIF